MSATYGTGAPKPNCTLKILVENMDIKDPNKSYKVTQHQLEKLPKSKYRPENYLKQLVSTQDNAAPASPDIHGDSDATLLYSSSDETIQYWPPDDDYNATM